MRAALVSFSTLPAMPAAACRLDTSIGTVASSVPWMISVGTVTAFRSGRKSVVENARAQPSVAFRLACMATCRDHSTTSWLTVWRSSPVP